MLIGSKNWRPGNRSTTCKRLASRYIPMRTSNTDSGPRRSVKSRAGASGLESLACSAKQQVASTELGSRRALVVEDDRRTRQTCQNLLGACGIYADLAESGVAALASARRRRPDILVVDSQLRDCSGEEFIRWIRSNAALRSVPVIVLCASADHATGSRNLDLVASLTKPISPDAMMAAIQEALRLSRLSQSALGG